MQEDHTSKSRRSGRKSVSPAFTNLELARSEVDAVLASSWTVEDGVRDPPSYPLFLLEEQAALQLTTSESGLTEHAGENDAYLQFDYDFALLREDLEDIHADRVAQLDAAKYMHQRHVLFKAWRIWRTNNLVLAHRYQQDALMMLQAERHRLQSFQRRAIAVWREVLQKMSESYELAQSHARSVPLRHAMQRWRHALKLVQLRRERETLQAQAIQLAKTQRNKTLMTHFFDYWKGQQRRVRELGKQVPQLSLLCRSMLVTWRRSTLLLQCLDATAAFRQQYQTRNMFQRWYRAYQSRLYAAQYQAERQRRTLATHLRRWQQHYTAIQQGTQAKVKRVFRLWQVSTHSMKQTHTLQAVQADSVYQRRQLSLAFRAWCFAYLANRSWSLRNVVLTRQALHHWRSLCFQQTSVTAFARRCTQRHKLQLIRMAFAAWRQQYATQKVALTRWTRLGSAVLQIQRRQRAENFLSDYQQLLRHAQKLLETRSLALVQRAWAAWRNAVCQRDLHIRLASYRAMQLQQLQRVLLQHWHSQAKTQLVRSSSADRLALHAFLCRISRRFRLNVQLFTHERKQDIATVPLLLRALQFQRHCALHTVLKAWRVHTVSLSIAQIYNRNAQLRLSLLRWRHFTQHTELTRLGIQQHRKATLAHTIRVWRQAGIVQSVSSLADRLHARHRLYKSLVFWKTLLRRLASSRSTQAFSVHAVQMQDNDHAKAAGSMQALDRAVASKVQPQTAFMATCPEVACEGGRHETRDGLPMYMAASIFHASPSEKAQLQSLKQICISAVQRGSHQVTYIEDTSANHPNGLDATHRSMPSQRSHDTLVSEPTPEFVQHAGNGESETTTFKKAWRTACTHHLQQHRKKAFFHWRIALKHLTTLGVQARQLRTYCLSQTAFRIWFKNTARCKLLSSKVASFSSLQRTQHLRLAFQSWRVATLQQTKRQTTAEKLSHAMVARRYLCKWRSTHRWQLASAVHRKRHLASAMNTLRKMTSLARNLKIGVCAAKTMTEQRLLGDGLRLWRVATVVKRLQQQSQQQSLGKSSATVFQRLKGQSLETQPQSESKQLVLYNFTPIRCLVPHPTTTNQLLTLLLSYYTGHTLRLQRTILAHWRDATSTLRKQSIEMCSTAIYHGRQRTMKMCIQRWRTHLCDLSHEQQLLSKANHHSTLQQLSFALSRWRLQRRFVQAAAEASANVQQHALYIWRTNAAILRRNLTVASTHHRHFHLQHWLSLWCKQVSLVRSQRSSLPQHSLGYQDIKGLPPGHAYGVEVSDVRPALTLPVAHNDVDEKPATIQPMPSVSTSSISAIAAMDIRQPHKEPSSIVGVQVGETDASAMWRQVPRSSITTTPLSPARSIVSVLSHLFRGSEVEILSHSSATSSPFTSPSRAQRLHNSQSRLSSSLTFLPRQRKTISRSTARRLTTVYVQVKKRRIHVILRRYLKTWRLTTRSRTS
eukprot:m.244222 g.244222  ORF g.244222 m.244222 type:complete len:1446 (+) comp15354_c0_seq3:91-4428(+)